MYTLSPQASRDFADILRQSARRWGELTVRRTKTRLVAQFERIGSGIAVGYQRHELPSTSPVRFVNEPPFVIAFDAETRTVLRVIHGRRDFARLFRG